VTAAWDAALGSALAGTARQPLAGAAADPARALLDAAAAHAVRRLAGWMPPTRGLSPPAACPPEDVRVVSAAAARRLAEMLAGGHSDLLPQWLELAAARRLVVPPRLLPALLTYVETDVRAPESALDVIGRRGHWLAAQVPSWAFAALGDLDAAFATGTRRARVAALVRLRRQNPAGALARLAAGWPGESGEDRVALVRAIEVGLGAGDEHFLEAAAGDPRKEVRDRALDLLVRLPGSRLVGRMRERVLGMVAFRTGRLRVEPPEAWEPELEAAGVVRRPPQGMGERAWWLSQVLGMVPPDAWPVEAAGAAGAAGATDWEAALLGGWARGAIRFQDARWAEALTLLWERTPEKRRPELGYGADGLVAGLPPAERDALLMGAFRRSPAWAARLAIRCAHLWGHELSAAFAGALPLLAAKPDLEAIQTLRMLGYRGDPAVEPEIARAAVTPTGVAPLDRALAEASDLLRWRAAMARELTS
jgi:hypothetical protein